MVVVRCEARDCLFDAASLRHLNGQSYLLCSLHLKMPVPLLHLEPPLDWKGVQRVYREAWANGRT
jgi:hypothetical protein